MSDNSLGKLLLTLCYMACVFSSAISAPSAQASDKPLATIFESSDNDLIFLQKGSLPERKSAAERRKDANKPNQSVKHRLVTLCLQNATTSSGRKAFDIRKKQSPRYAASAGKTVCAQFEPTHHTLYFWKTNRSGKMSLTLSNRVDLRDTDGTQINLTWTRD